ncbi:MAG: biotin--[acetyl-CoA-carboxylase] ligase [Acidimicrobiia bacterium]
MPEVGRSGSGPVRPSRSGPDRRFRVVWLTEVDSTNRYVLDAARAGESEGLVVVADHQRAGRGRLGRTWEAAPGSSLLVSVLLRPRRTVGELHLCTAAVALAMADAVGDVAGFTPDLKWPNDLLAGGRKLAGVLAEVELDTSGAVRAVVVGIGINVGEQAVPRDLAATATACDVVAGRSVDRRSLFDVFVRRLAERLDAPDPELVADYRARLATIGARVRVERSTGSLEGLAVDVDDLGALVLETEAGSTVTISAGDVVHLRPA